MTVGFTGTRRGMTPRQLTRLREELAATKVHAFHHGDCVGADAEAHAVAERMGLVVVVHPPEDSKYRAWCNGTVLPPRPYLKRNADIVRESNLLIACPYEREEPPIRRGQGTWSTVREARRRGVPVKVLWP